MNLLYQSSANYFRKVNWMLLIFLTLFLNVKMPVKVGGLILLLFINRKLFFEKGLYRQKFIGFYCSMIAITAINLFINIPAVSLNYFIATSVGVLFWLVCIAAAFLNIWFVSKTETSKLHTTITLFFVLNIAVTVFQLVLIIWDAGSINPYRYQGMHQKYFIGTGDLLTGITFDVSNTNALLNAFGLFYFLSRNKMSLGLLCMAAMLLTCSNFTNLLVTVILILLFVFQSTGNQKSIIIVCLFFLVIFMTKVSPQNNNYTTDTYRKIVGIKKGSIAIIKNDMPITNRPDSTLNEEERNQKIAMLYVDSLRKERSQLKKKKSLTGSTQIDSLLIASAQKRLSIPEPSIHTEPFQRIKHITVFQKELLAFAMRMIPSFDTSWKQAKSRKIPGKLVSFQQTFSYLKNNPSKIFFGTGTGNFSSKLAFRTTGLKVAGGYPEKFTYINSAFLEDHLLLYLNYASKDIELHSFINNPDSVYDQLISEYGLAGILAFGFLYAAFFIKKVKKLTWGIPLLLLLFASLGVEYWYEQLSIVIVFEFLVLLNLKETAEKHA